MNELDKSVYEALKFFADNTRARVATTIEENKDYYDNLVPIDVSDYLSEMKYILPEGQTKYMISVAGLKELRELEQIKNRDNVLKAAILAVVISIISLSKSFGWL